LVPTTLLLSIAAAREAIPFPVIVEALIMETTFEALREASIRLPRTVANAVSIIGALIIGTAAVEAGIVSAPIVIVVSLTGIASFAMPHFSAAITIRMLRFPLMIAAAMFGMFGIIMCLMILVGHMVGLRSFGVPYLAPATPLAIRGLKDVFVRAPLHTLDMRPETFASNDLRRFSKQMTELVGKRSGLIKIEKNRGKSGGDQSEDQ
jgi:spore germination protein KA/spore germination protein